MLDWPAITTTRSAGGLEPAAVAVAATASATQARRSGIIFMSWAAAERFSYTVLCAKRGYRLTS